VAKLCDIIESFIKELMQSGDGVVEIQRNDLASKFRCVPSQINYVISTRFNNEKGYHVQSRRGGGGHIRIQQVNLSGDGNYFMHIITSMGDSISQQSAEIFVKNFLDYGVINGREAKLIFSAMSDRIFIAVEMSKRDRVRANILKNMITSLLV
jgi:transcriptional regulator of stress and heat shock response